MARLASGALRWFTLRRGLRFTAKDGRRWEIVDITPFSQFVCADTHGMKALHTRADLLDLYANGQWLVDAASLDNDRDESFTIARRPFDLLSDTKKDELQLRFDWLQPLLRTRHVTTAQIESAIAATDPDSGVRPGSVRSVRRWLAALRIENTPSSLIDQRSGRRRRRPLELCRAISEAVRSPIPDTPRKDRASIARRFTKSLTEARRSTHGDEPGWIPSKPTIYRMVHELNPLSYDRDQHGARVATAKNRTAIHRVIPEKLLERTELDHQQLDVLVVHQHTGIVLGRPWLTVLLDCCSGMVLGFHISLHAPSLHAILCCLRMAILPKADVLARFPEVNGKWPAFGIPLFLVLDNGMEMHAKRIEEECQKLGTIVEWCPAYEPWRKPVVERFNRTLAEGLLHSLPGTTFSNPKDRGDYDSTKFACLTIQNLTLLVTKWIVEVYHLRPRRDHTPPPLDKWLLNERDALIRYPTSDMDADLLLGTKQMKKLHHYGIDLRHLKFNNLELQELRRRLVKNTDRDRKSPAVEIRSYPHTVEYIDVLDPDAKAFFRVAAVHGEYAAGLDRFTHDAICAHARTTFGSCERIEDLMRSKDRTGELIEQAISDQKRRKRDLKQVLAQRAETEVEPARRQTKRHQHQTEPDCTTGDRAKHGGVRQSTIPLYEFHDDHGAPRK